MSDPTRTDRTGGAAASEAVPALADPHQDALARRCRTVVPSGAPR